MATNAASAAIWAWGCQAQVGASQVIFNRYSMVVVDTKVKMGDVRNLRMTEINLPPGSPPHVEYEAVDINGGFEKTMVFTRKDDAKRKVIADRDIVAPDLAQTQIDLRARRRR